MSTLSYVNVFARDIEALSGFYRELFGFRNIPEIASPIFRGLDTGKSCIGFNAPEAYELLQLDEYADTHGCKFLLNIADQGALRDLLPLVSGGAAGPREKRVPHQPHALTIPPSGNQKC